LAPPEETVLMLTPTDDRFHPRSDDPYWNESAWFGFNIPERLISGWVYFYHRPNMNYTVGGVALWDPSGEHEWDCLHYDWGETVALAPGAEMFDFTSANGLTVTCDEPLKSFSLRYENHGCRLALDWDAFMEPQESMRLDATGNPVNSELPAGSEEWGSAHYEHGGHIRGTVSLAGEQLTVDCLGLRDHSWGPRRYTTNPRGDFASVFTSERNGFCMFAVGAQPRELDPMVGVADRLVFGWYLRDGEPSRLVSGTRTVIERDEQGRPQRIVVDGVDMLGRVLRADGRCLNHLWWRGYPSMFQWWSLCEWELDGATALGEEQDFIPLQQARRHMRNLNAVRS
jgi:hypothetical protein